MQCPKCHAPMHTYNRNGVQIEQCSGCRGIFLDYGELESLTRMESQWQQQAPPPPPAPQGYPAPAAPAWGAPQHGGHHGGHHGHHGHHNRGFGRMLFSS
ncbi:zf-TFIIB domain-containing protein [Streptomyces sp. NBC_00006]|uniref:TFIIB-type zinc ribbon-containing protein n=1 Tax=unclassified Streptomyces TaxID=2593676 RepID=UPI00224CF7B9|nr:MULTISPECIES: zf-TFIIB domain-containing protein [unclassified Streptomyces]MCX4833742.1 zf-TFIIB domain-containing protein [Streptomyces sp. NBC_01016]MCX5534724.1 zf-TFIIB domain-containing protein [Streptomyces sp. NBC_00006]